MVRCRGCHSLPSSRTKCFDWQVSIVYSLLGQIQFPSGVEVIAQQLSNWFLSNFGSCNLLRADHGWLSAPKNFGSCNLLRWRFAKGLKPSCTDGRYWQGRDWIPIVIQTFIHRFLFKVVELGYLFCWQSTSWNQILVGKFHKFVCNMLKYVTGMYCAWPQSPSKRGSLLYCYDSLVCHLGD
jgi:hypothetical protein